MVCTLTLVHGSVKKHLLFPFRCLAFKNLKLKFVRKTNVSKLHLTISGKVNIVFTGSFQKSKNVSGK